MTTTSSTPDVTELILIGQFRKWPFFTRGRIIRLGELGQTFVVGRIMRL